MKMLFLAVALSFCLCPAGALAADARADSPEGAGVKIFIHPDTGEILTREQWLDLGIEDERPGERSLPQGRAPEKQRPQAPLEGRLVELGNGDYLIVVDMPESHGVHTQVRFDEDGKPRLECDH